MTIIQKIKKFFKISNNSITSEEDERAVAEKRLNEQMAEDNKRKRALQEKLYNELQSRNLDDEKITAEKPLNEDLAGRNKQENASTKIIPKYSDIRVVEKNNFGKQSIEKQKNDELKIAEQNAEKRRFAKIKFEEERKKIEEQRKIDEISVKEEQVRAEEQRQLNEIRAEEQRIKAEEQRKLDEIAANERKILEKERLRQIHGLYDDQYREYLKEAEKFRQEFGKNVQCDVCGKWDGDLYVHRKQTYCEKCKPAGLQREHERKVIAGKHGASRDFIKK
jgi:hypothetical protein